MGFGLMEDGVACLAGGKCYMSYLHGHGHKYRNVLILVGVHFVLAK